MTMSANVISTQYLANSLVLPVQQAQAQLATATTEDVDRPVRRSRPQLGDQSGYELSLKEQVQRLQTLTAGNSVVATNLSTAAGRPDLDQYERPNDDTGLATWTAERQFGRVVADHGTDGAAGTHLLGQRDLGRGVRLRRDQ